MFEHVFHRMQEDIQDVIRPYQKKCDERLNLLFQDDSLLDRVAGYSLKAPGKRLRAILHLLVVEALGGDPGKALPGSLAYEMAHTASLVHDDIMDNAGLRRGREPAFRRFGLDAAIVSGDALLIRAFQMIEEYRETDLSREDLMALISCTARMGLKACRGQLMDGVMGLAPETFTIRDYLQMVAGKTASLIEGPCEGGAIVAGKKKFRRQAALFGRSLGIAFQILDDSKDIFSCESSSLKGRFTDLINNKPNIYLIWSLKKADPVSREKLLKIMNGHKPTAQEEHFLYDLLLGTGVLKNVSLLYRSYLVRSLKMLACLPETAGREKLGRIIQVMSAWPDPETARKMGIRPVRPLDRIQNNLPGQSAPDNP
ncbi:polyprenyl synthetase family protein [Desulfonatronovibrio hydrogenovorans]|uniref:polyprenyl synthetase family protein n=1 Tax=Desulfonatronovibrio hydrogenovorans TaxID=53245 RepID=UPI000490BA48|nr:polyprenyl synthetase family protein [Desulfonatronovibrio hydrogenovorans]